MTPRHLIIPIALAAMLPAGAQELNEQLTVHGIRRAEVVLRGKMDILPAELGLPVELSPMLSATQAVTAGYTPDFMPLAAPGWRNSLRPLNSPGYFVLGAGSFLDMTASAGYSFKASDAFSTNLWLQYDGSSLYCSNRISPFRRRYDGAAGFDMGYNMGHNGVLNAAAVYSLGYFNYYGTPDADTQTRNSAQVNIGWKSSSDNRHTFAAGVDYSYFGFRRTYLPTDFSPESFSGQSENHLRLQGNGTFATSGSDHARIDADLDFLFYSGGAGKVDGLYDVDNYGRLRLRPGYTFRRSGLNFDLGAKVDLMWNAGPESDRFDFLHVAPDVRIGYRAGMAGLSARITGGTELQTLQRAWQNDYYTLPQIVSTTPVYSPLDATAGVEIQPGYGLSFGMELMYKISNNHNPAGWYTPVLCSDIESASIYAPSERYDTKGFGASLNAGWKYGEKAAISLRGTYTPQSTASGYWNGIDRPRWVVDARGEVSPVSGLKLYVGYNYRGVRRLSSATASCRLSDLALLDAGASYNVWRGLTLWLRAGNILGCHASCSPSLYAPGFSMTGGFQLTF